MATDELVPVNIGSMGPGLVGDAVRTQTYLPVAKSNSPAQIKDSDRRCHPLFVQSI
jgi:hypothetical protein